HNGLDMAGDLSLVFDFLKAPGEGQVTSQEKFNLLDALPFFDDFLDAEIWEIVNASDWLSMRAGESVLEEGASDTAFYLIIDGSVAVRKNDIDIVELGKGDCFGEMGMLTGRPRSASICAAEDLTVAKLKETIVSRLSLNCQVRFQKQFLLALIGRLEHTTARVAAETP
ncbi:MAG: cyclic nucleotide-binding domain-containing protein, partial [Pseudomonadota bacterium]